jgi:flagellin-like protein
MTTRQRRAVSPVIATVILIAVAVALGIAVAFWASGLTSSFSKYEKLGVNVQYATGGGGTWTVYLGGQNTGSSDATITQIQINGIPYNANASSSNGVLYVTQASGKSSESGTTLSIPVSSGSTFALNFKLVSGDSSVSGRTFTDGQTIQVTLITAAGNNYPASIVLP